MQMLAYDVGHPGNEKAGQDGQCWILHAVQPAGHEPSERHTNGNAANGQRTEGGHSAACAESAGQRGSDGKTKEDQAGGIVDETFTLEQNSDSGWQRNS